MSEQGEVVPQNQTEFFPKQEERDKRLTDIGFINLGGSNIFESGAFVVGVKNDKYVFYSDMETSLPLETITNIKIANDGKLDYLALTGVDVSDRLSEHVLEPTTRSSKLNGIGRAATLINRFVPTKSMETQLLAAGFAIDDNAGNLFRRTFVREDSASTSSVEVMIVVEHGKIKKLVKEAKDKYHDTALIDRMGYEITGIQKIERLGDVLNARNDAMTFDITSDGSIINETLQRELTYEELGINPFPEQQSGGFKIGGVISTDTIRQLTEINGIPIEELERKMRPVNSTDRYLPRHFDEGRNLEGGGMSQAGFLGRQERLLDVLVQDNDYVLSLGLTHQDLAKELKYARELYFKLGVREFTYHGKRYRLKIEASRGIQRSPFNDGTMASSDMEITNFDTGKSLKTSLLVLHMIERYGFYEGHGTPYRVSPEDIIEVFDFLKDAKTKQATPS